MREINIGRVIMQGRKAKGITQEELAQFMGVSKAAVSKWETGQSYPDITYLPQLAAYFNISVDELLGYEPQMTKEEIRRLYYRLSEKFAQEPFEAVIGQCQTIIKKYISCFPLLLHMAILLVNHADLAPAPEACKQVFGVVKDLCLRIKEESDDVTLIRQANALEALAELRLGNAEVVVDLLHGSNDPPLGEEVLLAAAYQAAGDLEKARETSQVGVLRHLISLLGSIPSLLLYHVGDYAKFHAIMGRTLGLIELFNIKTLHPAILLNIYLAGSQGYLMLGDREKALDILEEYVELATADLFPLELRGDEIFDRVQTWLQDLDLGAMPPRSEVIIRDSIVQAVTRNPALQELAGEARFQQLVRKLENHFQKQR